MSEIDDGGAAFPRDDFHRGIPGMSLRDWFAGQALANPSICTGKADNWELTAWFGPHKIGIKRAEIIAKQAGEYATAMIADRRDVAGKTEDRT